MPFDSLSFLFLFLPLSLILYWALPRKTRRVTLLVISLLLLLGIGVAVLLTFCIGAILTYVGGILVEKWRVSKRRPALGIVVGIAVLEIVALLLLRGDFSEDWNTATWLDNVMYPLGFSYFILQSIRYLRDVFTGRAACIRQLFPCISGILFYPRLFYGPVLAPARFGKSLPNVRFSTMDLERGLSRFLIGLAKKIFLSDMLFQMCARILSAEPGTFSMWMVWLGVFAQWIAFYLACTGCMDMALGLARCYGVVLPEQYPRRLFCATVTQWIRHWNRSVIQTISGFFAGKFPRRTRFWNCLFGIVVGGIVGLWYHVSIPSLLAGIFIGGCVAIEVSFHGTASRSIVRFPVTFLLLGIACLFLFSPDLSTLWKTVQELFGVYGVALTRADTAIFGSFWAVLLLSIYVATGHWRTLWQKIFRSPRFHVWKTPLSLAAQIVLLLADGIALLAGAGTRVAFLL